MRDCLSPKLYYKLDLPLHICKFNFLLVWWSKMSFVWSNDNVVNPSDVFSLGAWSCEWPQSKIIYFADKIEDLTKCFASFQNENCLDEELGFLGLKANRTVRLVWKKTFSVIGSGCGSVGRAVASDTRGPWSESSHWQLLYRSFNYCQLYWKDENKEKEAGKTNNFCHYFPAFDSSNECYFQMGQTRPLPRSFHNPI